MAGIVASITSPPVSGAATLNPEGSPLHLHGDYTLNPLIAANASVTCEISPDGVTFTRVGRPSWPLALTPIIGSTGMYHMTVPAAWWYRITAVNAVLGALIGVTT